MLNFCLNVFKIKINSLQNLKLEDDAINIWSRDGDVTL